VIPLRRQIARRRVKVGAQRSSRGIKPPRLLYQTKKAIMRHVFRCLDRSQQPISESKDWVTVTLIQDLKGCCISVRCLFEQLFVCRLVCQSKRSIL